MFVTMFRLCERLTIGLPGNAQYNNRKDLFPLEYTSWPSGIERWTYRPRPIGQLGPSGLGRWTLCRRCCHRCHSATSSSPVEGTK